MTVPKLLIGSDFSETAAHAVEEGAGLAELLRADIEILHVADRGDAAALDHWRPPDSWTHAGAGSRSFIVREGLPWLELIRRADETGALLLIVGSHGRSGANPLTLGSTAAKLTLAAPCPVLIVHRRRSKA